MFDPAYRITGKVAKALMSIEADRQVVATLPLTAQMLDSLRRTARLLSTHFSTQIEGNQLSPSQVKAVVEGEGNFSGRKRDELLQSLASPQSVRRRRTSAENVTHCGNFFDSCSNSMAEPHRTGCTPIPAFLPYNTPSATKACSILCPYRCLMFRWLASA
jgi:hypothetical protein